MRGRKPLHPVSSVVAVAGLLAGCQAGLAQPLRQDKIVLSDDLKAIGVRGPAKRVEQRGSGKYAPAHGFEHLSFVKEFDRYGRLVLERWRDKRDQEFRTVKTVKFVRAGERVLAEEEWTEHGGVRKTVYRYDPGGRLLEKRIECGSRSGCVPVVTRWRYDDQGRKIEERVSRPDLPAGTGFPYAYVFTYDKSGHLVAKSLDRGGRQAIVETYRYDPAGRRIEQIDWLPGEQIERKTVFVYDASGRRTRAESVAYWDQSAGPGAPGHPVPPPAEGAPREGVEERRGVSAYDEFGELADTKSLVDGKVVEHNSFLRNEHGDVIRHVTHMHGSRYENTYTYDERGNWVRKSCTLNGAPHHVFERTIEYD